jgi:hypothetical protein
MATAELHTSILPRLDSAVSTGVDATSPATIDAPRVMQSAKWKGWIDDVLLQWLDNPGQLADDDVDPPSGTILRLALDHAEKLRDQGLPAPDSIIPDANGGIAFERRCNDISEVFHFWDDGTIEYHRFRGSHLVERYAI